MKLRYKFKRYYEFFRYDLKYIFVNLWIFKKEIYNFRPWDWSRSLALFSKGIERTCDCIEKYGLNEDKDKIISAMRELLSLLDIILNEKYLDEAEKQLNKKSIDKEMIFEEEKDGNFKLVNNLTEDEHQHNNEIYERSREIEEKIWKRMIRIIEGQGTFVNRKDFDGTGLKHWWD